MTKEQEEKIVKIVKNMSDEEIEDRIRQDEQEEAIEIIEKMVKSYIEADECGLSNNDFKHEIKAMQTVLSMLKEKDKEIEKYKYLYQKALDNTIKADRENIKLKKQIDLMADYIFQNIDVEEDVCNSAYVECTQETAQDITCINCIKQYFEQKATKLSQKGRKNVKTRTNKT